MIGYTYIISLTVWAPGFITGLLILVCNALHVQLSRHLQTIDVIVTLIILSNLLAGVLNIIVVLLLSLHLCPHMALLFLWEVTSGIQKWVTSLICVFFYLKIVPGKSPIFLWMKSHFSFLVVNIILVGIVCSLITSIIDLFFEEHHDESVEGLNCSYTKLPPSLSVLKLFWKSFNYSSVLALMVFSSGALMAHLIAHMRKMQGNNQLNQHGVARAAFMIFFLAFEFVVCAIARHTLAAIFQHGLTEVSMNSYCLVNLTLSTIVPITLIVGISALRQRIASLTEIVKCFSCLCFFPNTMIVKI
uniref:Taste receptor type 2 n=1 Tax=Paramormyrops kingsleyae TaxID=1676925 RepID=A0A3B3TEV6_9TELE